MEVTYLGVVHGTQAALRHTRQRDAAAIAQVGSALAYRGIPLQSAYCAAKHAVPIESFRPLAPPVGFAWRCNRKNGSAAGRSGQRCIFATAGHDPVHAASPGILVARRLCP
jgi:hypothetical protein